MSQHQTDLSHIQALHTPRRNAGRRASLEGPTSIIGPTGEPLSREDLPPPGTKRWVVRRKAEVVAGVRGGLISLKEALKIYDLTIDEFRSWQRLLDSHGLEGLRTTRLKKYRQPDT